MPIWDCQSQDGTCWLKTAQAGLQLVHGPIEATKWFKTAQDDLKMFYVFCVQFRILRADNARNCHSGSGFETGVVCINNLETRKSLRGLSFRSAILDERLLCLTNVDTSGSPVKTTLNRCSLSSPSSGGLISACCDINISVARANCGNSGPHNKTPSKIRISDPAYRANLRRDRSNLHVG